jgi:hypothetical protein
MPVVSGRTRKCLFAVAIVLSIVAIGIALPSTQLTISGWRFRNHGAKRPFLYVYQALQNGQAIEHVQELLGPGNPNDDPKYRRLCAEVFALHTDDAPSGITESDVLLGYSVAKTTIHFQFRNGKLINHDPKQTPFMESSLR